jgi:hypothetical protein
MQTNEQHIWAKTAHTTAYLEMSLIRVRNAVAVILLFKPLWKTSPTAGEAPSMYHLELLMKSNRRTIRRWLIAASVCSVRFDYRMCFAIVLACPSHPSVVFFSRLLCERLRCPSVTTTLPGLFHITKTKPMARALYSCDHEFESIRSTQNMRAIFGDDQ